MTKRVLNRLGIRISSRGHQYLAYAVKLIQIDASLLFSVTGTLYPAIASCYGVTAASVEHAIRYCLQRCWEYGNRALLNEIAGYPLQYRPYSKEFIAMLAEYTKEPAARAANLWNQ